MPGELRTSRHSPENYTTQRKLQGSSISEIEDGESSEGILTVTSRGCQRAGRKIPRAAIEGGGHLVRRLGPSGFYIRTYNNQHASPPTVKKPKKTQGSRLDPSALFTSEDTQCLPLSTLFLGFLVVGVRRSS